MPLPFSICQQQLIRLVAKGYADSEIAHKMGLSKNQLQRAFSDFCDQLDVSNRLQLILLVWSSAGHISVPVARARDEVDPLKVGWNKMDGDARMSALGREHLRWK
jgi:DNA-binding CsgD family transcriptional regulator